MSRQVTMTIRLDPDTPEGQKAIEYLRNRDRTQFRSYGDLVTEAVIQYFESKSDSIFETQEQENQFFRKIRASIQQVIREETTSGSLSFQPTGEHNGIREKRKESLNMAMDFIDSFLG